MSVSIKSPTSTTGAIQLNASDVLTIDSSGNLTAPNNLTVTGTVNGLSSGKGANSLSDNTAFGNNALSSITTGNYNTAVGINAGRDNTSGQQNVFVGRQAGQNNTTGSYSSFVGQSAGLSNTTGASNTAVGRDALFSNTTGGASVAVGYQALYSDSTTQNAVAVGYYAGRDFHANNITAVGYQALQGAGVTSTGVNNVGIGYQAGYSTTSGQYNTYLGTIAGKLGTTAGSNVAIGNAALYSNVSGLYNVAIGRAALYTNEANYNVAVGYNALNANVSGIYNTALGSLAGDALTSGGSNTSLGYGALPVATTAASNISIGRDAHATVTTGAYNHAIGQSAGYQITGGTFNLHIGHGATASGANVHHEMYISSANGGTAKGGNTGFINPNGGGVYQGNNSSTWSTTSDARLKKNIVDNNTGLDAIKQIQVRNFEYRLADEITDLPKEQVIDKQGIQLGVIAQEIQQVLPDMVKEESTGVLSVDPDNMTWYLVNAVKELSAKVEELQTEINVLKGK